MSRKLKLALWLHGRLLDSFPELRLALALGIEQRIEQAVQAALAAFADAAASEQRLAVHQQAVAARAQRQ